MNIVKSITSLSKNSFDVPQIAEQIPTDIIISDEYQKAIDMIDSGSAFTLISGKAGTGKSTFIRLLQNRYENIVTLAPTGIAALNIKGQTVHSFCRLPLHPVDYASVKYVYKEDMYKAIRYLIIDEISMVRADILDGINWFLQKNRDSDEPFGGVQVIAVGDIFQLPPVVVSHKERHFIDNTYTNPYFFSALAYGEANPKLIEFTTVYRQKDEKFVKLLNFVREGEHTEQTVKYLNKHCLGKKLEGDNVITLTATNDVANTINDRCLSAIAEKEYLFEAIITGSFGDNKENLPAPKFLYVKVGAQVMFTQNNTDAGYVNGTIGKITDIDDDGSTITVEVEEDGYTNTYRVKHVTRDRIAFDYDPKLKKIGPKVIGQFTQFPLKLAWAVTIHKAQGQSFDKVVVDLGSGAFASGQLYVALSRCRTLEGLSVTQKIKVTDVILDPEIQEFHNIMREVMKTP